jgi:hypothetical protein
MTDRRTVLTVLGAAHVIAALVLSWALVVKLTPPNKPVENGLELLFPGALVLLLGVPFALAGIALIARGMRAVTLAVNVDVAVLILVIVAFAVSLNVWVALAALPFAVDLAAVRFLARRAPAADS